MVTVYGATYAVWNVSDCWLLLFLLVESRTSNRQIVFGCILSLLRLDSQKFYILPNRSGNGSLRVHCRLRIFPYSECTSRLYWNPVYFYTRWSRKERKNHWVASRIYSDRSGGAIFILLLRTQGVNIDAIWITSSAKSIGFSSTLSAIYCGESSEFGRESFSGGGDDERGFKASCGGPSNPISLLQCIKTINMSDIDYEEMGYQAKGRWREES